MKRARGEEDGMSEEEDSTSEEEVVTGPPDWEEVDAATPHGYVEIGDYFCDVSQYSFVILPGKRRRKPTKALTFHHRFPSGDSLQVTSYRHGGTDECKKWLGRYRVNVAAGRVKVKGKTVDLYDPSVPSQMSQTASQSASSGTQVDTTLEPTSVPTASSREAV